MFMALAQEYNNQFNWFLRVIMIITTIKILFLTLDLFESDPVLSKTLE